MWGSTFTEIAWIRFLAPSAHESCSGGIVLLSSCEERCSTQIKLKIFGLDLAACWDREWKMLSTIGILSHPQEHKRMPGDNVQDFTKSENGDSFIIVVSCLYSWW